MDRESLVWSQAGQLYRAELVEDGVGEENLLFDFNGMSFETIKAPYADEVGVRARSSHSDNPWLLRLVFRFLWH